MSTDVGNFSFKQARDFHKGRKKNVRLVGIHATATVETSRIAENIQNTWTRDDGRDASAHVICDDDSTVRCVHDDDTAWSAKSANSDGVHVEIVGQANQSKAQYADTFSKKAIRRAAYVTALWCKKYGIPPRRLTTAQLRDGKSKGIAGHSDIDKAFPSSRHSDPGPNFPWDQFLALVRVFLNPPRRALRLTSPMMKGDDVAEVARAYKRMGYKVGLPENVFGKQMDAATRSVERRMGRAVTGKVDAPVRKFLRLPA